MLEITGDEPFQALIQAAPCRLQWSGELDHWLADPPGGSTSQFDERQMARLPGFHPAAAEVTKALPAFPRAGTRAQAIITDISLRGLRLVFDLQLWPGERVAVWLPDWELTGEVVRCRRLGQNCFEIGIRLAAAIPPRLLRQFLSERLRAGNSGAKPGVGPP